MLTIWGIRVFFHTTGEGVFHCQLCGAGRQYRSRSGRRFFTLFLVPLIPLNTVGGHVQCRTCGTRYHAGVLALHATALPPVPGGSPRQLASHGHFRSV